MKKVVLLQIIILVIVVGCGNKSNDTVDKNTKGTSDLTEDEKIWISTSNDEFSKELDKQNEFVNTNNKSIEIESAANPLTLDDGSSQCSRDKYCER